MTTYSVTATYKGRRSRFTLTEPDDTAATYAAMFAILERAQYGRRGSTVWALGRIELSRAGEIVRTMEAK